MPLILVVDDNDDHRSMYTTFLQLSGFRVIEAPDGLSGISEAHAVHPDIILMDLDIRQRPPEVAPLRRWLDCWTGLGAIVTGMER